MLHKLFKDNYMIEQLEQIEELEMLMDNKPCQVLIDGLTCIHLSVDMSVTDNVELIKKLENVR